MSKDPYFDEKIGTLRNLLGAKSAEELELIEPQWVFANQLELEQAHIPRTNDLSELLALHAWLFREGNGRVQRIFWSRVARDVGYDLDWDDVIGDENDEASRLAAELMDRSRLETMFRRIVHRVDDES